MNFPKSKADILAIGTFKAPHIVSQSEYISFQEESTPEWSDGLSRLIRQTGVETRQSYLPDWRIFFKGKIPTTTERNDAYETLLYPVLTKNLEEFIATNNIDKSTIGGVVTVSCTGISNPTLDTKVVAYLQLASCLHWHIGYMGCHGGIIGLQSGAALCSLAPGKIVLVICIEACSLHYQNGLDPDVQISNALFSDGCVITAMRKEVDTVNSEKSGSLMQLTGMSTQTFAEGAKYLTWNVTQAGWLMGLSPKLPALISKALQNSSFDTLRGNKNLVVHPGGRAILRAVENGLNIPRLVHSHAVLKQYGNMSSVSIFFCLQELLKHDPCGHEEICLMGFGPGLDVSTVTLRCNHQ